MIQFREFFVIVRKHVPMVSRCDLRDIPQRVMARATKTVDVHIAPQSGRVSVLEFCGECYWRVALSQKLAPDGFKRLAYVVGAVRVNDLPPGIDPRETVAVVNAMLNHQYREYIARDRVSA